FFRPFGQVSQHKDIDVTVGGSGGASGDGALVRVSNSKDITTHGDASNGIFAQSVGGGGGVGGSATIGATGKIRRGGAPGRGGAVGVVTGRGAGVLAAPPGDQPFDNLGIGLAVGGAAGAGGDGGVVGVGATGDILTHGDSAAGIFAQSVGGGGGMLGELGNDL